MKPRSYYNEFDPFAAAWLRELIKEGLIADGDVDERSICDVQSSDLEGYTQCHFFAGIGGWSLALRIAGWPDDVPVFSGSAPCQPFSVAGKARGADDERHLWPEFRRIIEACRPEVVFGEQVVSADVVGTELEATFVDAVQRGDYAAANRAANRLVKLPTLDDSARWVDGVFADLEAMGYACRASDLPAASVGAPHIRQRLYWGAKRLADAASARHAGTGEVARGDESGANSLSQRKLAQHESSRGCSTGGLEHAASDGRQQRRAEPGGRGVAGGCGDGHWLLHTVGPRLEGHAGHGDDGNQPGRLGAEPGGHTAATGDGGFWSDFRVVQCRDGKARHVPAETEPGFQRLVDGLPDHLAAVWRDCGGTLYPLTDAKTPGRVGLLRGFGNAIVPAVAAAFITAFRESVSEQ